MTMRRLFFEHDTINYFHELEELAEGCNDNVALFPMFIGYDFTEEDCLNAEMLWFKGECLDGIGLAKQQYNTEMLKSREKIEMLSFIPIKTRIVITSLNMILFHTTLIEEITLQGLSKGLITVPVSLEIVEKGISSDWFCITSETDLGIPAKKKRFIKGFDRTNWNGEDFCISSHYDPPFLYVSQGVYRFLNSLPDDKKGTLDCEPVELI